MDMKQEQPAQRLREHYRGLPVDKRLAYVKSDAGRGGL